MTAALHLDEIDRAGHELGARQNLHRLQNISLVIVPIVVGHILYFALSGTPEMSPAQLRWRLLNRDVQLMILGALLALMAASFRVWRRPELPLGWRAHLPTAFAILFVCGTALVAAVDQLVTSAITPFVTASLAVALVLRLSPRANAIVYGAGLLVLAAGVAVMQQATDARTSVLLNSVTLTGVSAAIAVTLTRTFLQTERARRTIEHQSQELLRLRGLLRVCAWCKRVSNENQDWEALEAYVARTSGVDITHGMCEACFEKFEGGVK